MRYDEIHIGNYVFEKGERKVFLKDEARKQHCHIIGGTGTGKSKLMEHMIRQDIRNGKGVCLIDPHGNLFESILKWSVANGYKHRLVVIDPNEKGWSVGLNFLEYDKDLFDVGQHVENVITEMGKARNEDLYQTAQVVIWLRNFLQLAALCGLTLEDMYLLLNEKNKQLRHALTESITDDKKLVWQLTQAWNEYDSATPKTRSEMMKLPVWARIQTFLATRTMRQIVGQSETTVDFYKAMEKGSIVLINLHGGLSENEKNLLGSIVIDKIFQAAQKRKPESGKLFFVYIDEFGRFVSERITLALEELRKRHVPFIFAHQELEQLHTEDSAAGKRLLAAIMTNAKIKIAFRISRKDAEAMALEMFAGFITGNEIKHEQKVTSFWPVKTRETSHAYGEGMSEGEISSFVEGVSEMSSQFAGQVYVPGAGFMDASQLVSHSVGSASSLTSGHGRGTVTNYSKNEVEIDFPFYDLEPFDQVVSTAFYSIEEIKERYYQFLQNQKERYFHVRIIGETDRPPIALVTPTVKAVPIMPSILKKAKLESIKKYSKPTHEIDRLCEARRNELLQFQGDMESKDIDPEMAIPEPDDDRWQKINTAEIFIAPKEPKQPRALPPRAAALRRKARSPKGKK